MFQPSAYSYSPAPIAVARSNRTVTAQEAHKAVAVLGVVVALATVNTFVVTPYLVKLVYPDWTYGKRFAVGMVTSSVVGSLARMSKAAL